MPLQCGAFQGTGRHPAFQFQDRNAGDGTNIYEDNIYDSYNHWAVSAAWGNLSDGLYLAVMGNARSFEVFKDPANVIDEGKYANVVIDDYTVTGVEAVISYCFANGVQLMTGWEWMNIDMDGAEGVDSDAYVIPVYVNYQINPNFRVWAEARFDAGTDDGKNDSFKDASNGVYNYEENVFSVGARYTF